MLNIPEENPVPNAPTISNIAEIFIENFVKSKNPEELINQVIEKDIENTGLYLCEFTNVNDSAYFSVLHNKTCHHCKQKGVNVLHCSYVGQCCRKCIDVFIEEANKKLNI